MDGYRFLAATVALVHRGLVETPASMLLPSAENRDVDEGQFGRHQRKPRCLVLIAAWPGWSGRKTRCRAAKAPNSAPFLLERGAGFEAGTSVL
jgi:hypothetical protein